MATPPVLWQILQLQTQPSELGKRTAVDWVTTIPTSSTSLEVGRIAVYVLLLWFLPKCAARLMFGVDMLPRLATLRPRRRILGTAPVCEIQPIPTRRVRSRPSLSRELVFHAKEMLTTLGRRSPHSVSSPRAHQARGEQARIRLFHDARDLPRTARSVARSHPNRNDAVFGSVGSGRASNTAEWSTCPFRH